MVVGNNESTATKNAGESLAISIAMASRVLLETTGCCHRSIARAVLPQRPPWSTNSNKTPKTLTKQNF